MLSFFQIERCFNKTTAKLYVDVHRKEANLTILHDRRIRRTETLPIDQDISRFGQNSFVKLTDVDGAEAFLSRDMGEQGSLIEYMDWACQRGII